MSNGSGTSNIGEIAAALSGVIAVFAALAAAGVIGEAQRNHGYWLLIGIGFVLLGAVLWLVATLVPSDPSWVQWLLRGTGLASFAIGLFLGVWAIYQTQQDSERPAVSSAFENGVLTVEATAHGLRGDSRLVVEVSGFTGTPDAPMPQKKPPTLYFAVVGPNSDGDIDHTAHVPIPAKYTVIGVRAWTGKNPTTCTAEGVEDKVKQHDRAGCLFLQVRQPDRRRTDGSISRSGRVVRAGRGTSAAALPIFRPALESTAEQIARLDAHRVMSLGKEGVRMAAPASALLLLPVSEATTAPPWSKSLGRVRLAAQTSSTTSTGG
jgi:hypothetical protein